MHLDEVLTFFLGAFSPHLHEDELETSLLPAELQSGLREVIAHHRHMLVLGIFQQ